MAENVGFKLSQAKISYVLGLVALLGIGWQVVTYFEGGASSQRERDLTQDFRIEKNATGISELKNSFDKLGAQTERLTDAVTRLTVVIETERNRAEYQPRFFWEERREYASINGTSAQ